MAKHKGKHPKKHHPKTKHSKKQLHTASPKRIRKAVNKAIDECKAKKGKGVKVACVVREVERLLK